MTCPKCGKEMKLTGVDTYYCDGCRVAFYLDYAAGVDMTVISVYKTLSLAEQEKLDWGDEPIGYQLGC